MRLVEDVDKLAYLIRGKLALPMLPAKVHLFGIGFLCTFKGGGERTVALSEITAEQRDGVRDGWVKQWAQSQPSTQANKLELRKPMTLEEEF